MRKYAVGGMSLKGFTGSIPVILTKKYRNKLNDKNKS